MASKLKLDLKQLFSTEQVESLSKHFSGYEKRVKDLVKELDLKSRDAREKSREQLARFTSQVRKTSTDVEKNVKTLLHQEGKVLNQKVTELVAYLKSLATSEQMTAPLAAAPKARATAAKSIKAPTAKKATTSARTKKSGKKASGSASASA